MTGNPPTRHPGEEKSSMTDTTYNAPAGYTDRHPSTQAALRPFTYSHLPEHLQKVSRPFCELAYEMVDALEDDPELTTGLRKLREAKDCCVLAAVLHDDGGNDE